MIVSGLDREVGNRTAVDIDIRTTSTGHKTVSLFPRQDNVYVKFFILESLHFLCLPISITTQIRHQKTPVKSSVLLPLPLQGCRL